MIDQILQASRECDFDFRQIANPDDPLKHLFPEWVEYYRLKATIAAAIQPRSILEIGVRYGYSAAAFLHGAPGARFTGIDLNNESFGGNPGAIAWAEQILPRTQTELIIANTQHMARFPGDHYDLIHIDGQQDGDGTFHDLLLGVKQATWLLVDGYLWTKPNFQAASEFLRLHSAIIDYWCVIPGYAGELLIKVRPARGASGAGSAAQRELFDRNYYLRSWAGWENYRRAQLEIPEPRLRNILSLALSTSPRTLLDLGCGRGEVARAAAEQGCAVLAVDYSSTAVELTKDLAVAGVPPRGSISVFCADAVAYRSPHPVDCIVLADVLEHLDERESDALLANAARQLTPGGRLVVHTLSNKWFQTDHYPRRRRAAAAAGFYLPPDQRTHFERSLNLMELSPVRLRRLLQKHFPHVLLWVGNADDPGGSLVRNMTRDELTAQTDTFAIACMTPLDRMDFLPLFQTFPLGLEIANQVRLSAARSISARAGTETWVTVDVENQSSQWLVSRPPYPIHLSYHVNGNGLNIFDGLRTYLVPPIGPGRRATFKMKLVAPNKKGNYELTLALVQESIRWFEPSAGATTPRLTLEVG